LSDRQSKVFFQQVKRHEIGSSTPNGTLFDSERSCFAGLTSQLSNPVFLDVVDSLLT
jgi:hypothetical protein